MPQRKVEWIQPVPMSDPVLDDALDALRMAIAASRIAARIATHEFTINPRQFRTFNERVRDVAHSEPDQPKCPACGNRMGRKVTGPATISTTAWKCWHCPIDTAPEVEDVACEVVEPKQLPEHGDGVQ